MLKLNSKQQRLPIGGHHFTQYGVTFRADTFPALVKELVGFRISNNHPVGEPDQEILAFYAKNWPYMVEADDGVVIHKQSGDYVDWRTWVYETCKSPPSKFLSQSEVGDRIKICADCPKMKGFDGWSRSQEMTEVARRAFLLRRGMFVPDFIGYCSCHKADLPALLFIENPQAFSKKDQAEEAPETCWVKG